METKTSTTNDNEVDVSTSGVTGVAKQSYITEEVLRTSPDVEKELGASTTLQDAHVESVVDWDGDDDSTFPMNWTNIRKFKNIAVICYCTFLT